MTCPRQGDLFQGDEQPELFDDESHTPTFYPDPDRVRAELHSILAEARGAQVLPWDASTLSLYQTIFPQMTRCLPEEEAEQLCFAFETEMARLKAA
jgi:hypothetical protein